MAQSMTGYGRGEHSSDRYQFGIEIRSTNHRFLEVRLRVPRELIALEGEIRTRVRSRFSRGYFDVQALVAKTAAGDRRFSVDRELLGQVASALQEAGNSLGLGDPVDLAMLSQFKEVFRFDEEPEDVERMQEVLFAAVDAALEALEASRRREGEEIQRSVSAGVDRLESLRGRMEALAPDTNRELADSLRRRLDELLGQGGLSPERLHQEAALLAVKSDVTEELERLRGHLSAFRESLQEEGPVGRKLDFLVQEMNRELNTTAAKAGTLELSHLAIEGRLELEKVREQIQNLE